MADVTSEVPLTKCFAENIPLLDFQLDDSPNFYHKLGIWSKKVREVSQLYPLTRGIYKSN